MNKSAYIITKPLQYINATNIIDSNNKVCLLIDAFFNSNKLFENIKKHSKNWDDCVFLKNRNQAFKYIYKNKSKFDKIFIDSDIGVLNRFFLTVLYPIEINIYEEGFGNYRKEVLSSYLKNKPFLNCFYFLTGKKYLGGFTRTKKIHLYYPHVFLKLVDNDSNKEITVFNNNFYDHLLTLKEVFELYSPLTEKVLENKNILIYLTARKIDDSINKVLNEYTDFYKILKPHPEFKNSTGIENEFDLEISNDTPAELLIVNVLKKVQNLIVVHHGDTTLLNVIKIAKFNEINISNNEQSRNNYNKIKDTIING